MVSLLTQNVWTANLPAILKEWRNTDNKVPGVSVELMYLFLTVVTLVI